MPFLRLTGSFKFQFSVVARVFLFSFLGLSLFVGSTTRAEDGSLDPDNLYSSYGFLLGPSMSTAAVNDAGGGSRTSRLGDAIGVFGEFPITPWLSFRPEINYITKGSYDATKNLTQLAYLQLPLLMQLQWSFSGGQIFFPIGLCAGALVGKTEVSAQNSYYQIAYGTIANDELSLVAGAGVAFDVEEHYRLFAMLRTDYGLTNVAQFQVNGTNASYYSRNFSLLLGVSYTLDPDTKVFDQRGW